MNAQPAIEKLQLLALKIATISVRAETILKGNTTSTGPAVSSALVALGLCKQAREQVSAACQNLGITLESLPFVQASGQVSEGAQKVVSLISNALKVQETSVASGIDEFVSEMLAMGAIIAIRADEFIKRAENAA